MASSSFYAQKLFNSFIELSNTPMQSQAEVNEAISNWIGVLMESTIINFVLANTLVDMSNEETKSTFYSLMYEFLNSATTDEPKTIH